MRSSFATNAEIRTMNKNKLPMGGDAAGILWELSGVIYYGENVRGNVHRGILAGVCLDGICWGLG